MSINNTNWQFVNFLLIIVSIPLSILLVFISRKRDKLVKVPIDRIPAISMRLLSYLIDLVILANIEYVIYKYSFYIVHDIGISTYIYLYPFVVFLYVTLSESSRLQGTVGKYSVGIIIVRNDGRRISFILSATRLILDVFFSIVFPFTLSVIFFSKYKQCAHDIITNTVVIKSQ